MAAAKRKRPAVRGGSDSSAVGSGESSKNYPPITDERKAAALAYAERGWHVFPLHSVGEQGQCTCGAAKCSDAGKHPVTNDGFKSATDDPAKIKKWWTAHPDANVGIRTGQVSGLTVIDIDIGEKGGSETWAALTKDKGEPQTLMAETGSGGMHVLFKYNSALKTGSNVLGPGVDCRNDDGYIVAPPSRHKSGRSYSWLNAVPLADLPAHLTRKPSEKPASKKGGRKHDLEAVKKLLEHVSPDGRDTWRNVGIILGREFERSDEAWEVYAEWAAGWDGKKGRNHDEIMRECFYKLSAEEGPMDMDTLMAWARKGGWQDGRWRFELIPANKLEVRAIDWLVHGLLERDTLAQIFGLPGSGKSFAALDLACCIATGTAYHSRKVKQGPVVYIAGEGTNGLTRRLTAWRIRHKVPLSGDLYVSKVPARMTEGESVAQVLSAIDAVESEDRPALVVFDTLARNFGPGNENAQEDMTTFVHACDEIRLAYRCCVLLVHHVGHTAQDRGRGSSVLDGALDVSYRMKRTGDVIVVEPSKHPKDAAAPESFAFKIQPVELGFDNEDGTPATSVVLEPVGLPEPPKGPTGRNQKAAYSVLDEMQQDGGPVRLDAWKRKCKEKGVGGGPKNLSRTIAELIGKGTVGIDGDIVKTPF